MRTPSHLALRGAACALIGAIVLIAPHVLSTPDLRTLLAGAAPVGWFAVLLGLVLCVVGLRRGR